MSRLADYLAARFPTPRTALIALDLDGTLLWPDESIPTSAIEALTEATERGAAVVVTTGRRYRVARLPVAQLPFPFLLLSHNGALLKDPTTHETVDFVPFPEPLIGPVWQGLLARGMSPVAHLDRHDDPPEIISSPPLPGSYHETNLRERYQGIAHISTNGELPPHPVVQILAFGTPEDTEAAAADLAVEHGAALYVHAMRVPLQESFVLEVLHPEAGKWPGVQRIATALGIPHERVVAMGDDANDIPMLQGAGLGLAMGNATPAARAAAKYAVASNLDHGIAEGIRKFALPLLET